MSLVNNLLSSGKSVNLYGTGVKYHITTSDIVALGAFTTGNIVLDNLPAGAVVTYGRVKHSEKVAGGSLSTATIDIATANNTFLAAPFDIFAAVADATSALWGPITVTPVGENYAAVTPIYATIVGSHNLNTATTGAVDVWIQYIVLK